MIKLESENHLCKHVCQIILSVNLFQLNIAIFKNIPHEVISDINMLHYHMVDLVLH